VNYLETLTLHLPMIMGIKKNIMTSWTLLSLVPYLLRLTMRTGDDSAFTSTQVPVLARAMSSSFQLPLSWVVEIWRGRILVLRA